MNAGRVAVRFSLMMAFVWVATTAWASGTSELRKQAEASMVLTGTVEVAQDGSLRRYELDHPEQIDPAVRDFVERNIKSWSFEVGSLPAGVSPTATIRNSMSVLVVAKPVEGNTYSLRLAGSNFNAAEPEPGTQLGYANVRPPAYPQAAVAAGVKGKVFLMVKVGRNGTVEDAIAEQVNLGVVARNEKEMERWRKVLAQAALGAVKRWTFVYPTHGEQADKPFIVARVPVEYFLRPETKPKYGEWASYVPGPREANPWEPAEDNPGFAPDALAANGGLYSNDGLRLKTPLQGVADGG